MTRKNILLIFFLGAIWLWPGFVWAETYDFYVDKSYGKEEDGSAEKPFNTISEALNKAGTKKKDLCERRKI